MNHPMDDYGHHRTHGNRHSDYKRFGDRPKPVETGKEYDVSITEISRRGEGIARVEGFVIFVKGGQVGQNAKVKITQVGERFASAELVGKSELIVGTLDIRIRNLMSKKNNVENRGKFINYVTSYANNKGLQIGQNAADDIIQVSSDLYRDIDKDAEILAKKNNIPKSDARSQLIKAFFEFLKTHR